MRIRRIIDESSGTEKKRSVVWFGSYGVNEDGTAKFVNPTNKHDNFVSQKEYVRDALIQKLSVIRHELWYAYTYGMPLTDNDVAKVTIDNFVMTTIQSHQYVLEIVGFESKIINHTYSCDVQFTTTFGNVSLSI